MKPRVSDQAVQAFRSSDGLLRRIVLCTATIQEQGPGRDDRGGADSRPAIAFVAETPWPFGAVGIHCNEQPAAAGVSAGLDDYDTGGYGVRPIFATVFDCG